MGQGVSVLSPGVIPTESYGPKGKMVSVFRAVEILNRELESGKCIVTEVGFLGVINRIFGVNNKGQGYIMSIYEDGKLVRFEVNE
jgi:hypothetical protein